MPKYKYSAIDEAGRDISGSIDGATVHTVASDLIERGFDLRRVVEKTSPLQFEITRAKIKRAEVMHFSRQLAAFVRAGVSLPSAMDSLRDESRDKTLKKVLADMAVALRQGDSFSAAIAPHAYAFPPFYVSVLRPVDLTGQLHHGLEQLADYLDRDIEARRKIKSAIAYPALVILMSFITVGVLAGFVLPRFKTFFKGFHAQLPLPTRMLLSVTDFVGDAWPWLLVGGLVALIVGVVASRVGWGRTARDRFLLQAPVIGVIVRYAIVERFCRILSSMVEAGVPLPDALELATEGTHNKVFKRALLKARDAMVEGQGLAAPITETALFPGAVTQMIRVGEDTGTLDDQLAAISSYYEKELEYKLKNLTTIIEPAVIITVGLLVGFVALALVSAMYGIFNQVKL